jgi:Gram-negative bacterial TonB protein C-terminal
MRIPPRSALRSASSRRALTAGAVSLLLLLTGGPPAAAGGDETPPVLLRGGEFFTPEAAAGSGVAPEVKVRVTVDATGRVSKAEVLKIEPSSPFDDAFRRATVDNLLDWHYAPARADGKSVETVLVWSVQFLAKEAPEASQGGLAGAVGDETGSLRRARVFGLPLAARKALLERDVKVAEKHLDATHRQRADSPRFVVVSDAPAAGVAQTVAGNLEAAYNVLDALFRPQIEPQPEPYKVIAYVYWSRASFEATRAELEMPSGPTGFYGAPGFLVFHLEAGDADDVLHVMLHEAFHAYADRHLSRPGTSLPLWLDEGFAEYFGNSDIEKGKLVPGRIVRGKLVMVHGGGAYRRQTYAAFTLDDVRRQIHEGKALPLAQLMTADRRFFYGGARNLCYAMAWLAVHFLRHGGPEWATDNFPTLVLYLAEGYPTADALRAAYGATPEELEEAFRAYVKRL